MANLLGNGVAILTVATNQYFDYWQVMALSADRFFMPDVPLTFYVFTDQPSAALQTGDSLTRSRVVPVEIDALGWPDATLLRYELFADSWDLLTEDCVVHLDADMKVTQAVVFDTDPYDWENGLALVRHPGYRRPSLLQRIGLYMRYPKILKGDIEMLLRFGGLGAWETSSDSLAYVPRSRRRTYVCGGTWMGLREPMKEMIEVLASRTRKDLTNGIVAKWHDESHLNWYASHYSHHQFDSSKCYAPGYPQLRDLTPEIIAVDKGENRVR